MALSTAIPLTLNKKLHDLWSTNTGDHAANVYLPYVDCARSAYANTFEFKPRDLTATEISTL